MARYSQKIKEAVIRKMMPPHNIPIAKLKKETGITDATLYTWRKQAKAQGIPVPGDGKNPQQWSAQDKLAVLMETAVLNSAELSEYCRKRGLYPENIEQWKSDFIAGYSMPAACRDALSTGKREDRKRIQQLEKDLRRKEKALAETAALLVLSKKANAIWGDREDD